MLALFGKKTGAPEPCHGRTAVRSNGIACLGYDPVAETLQIEFLNGMVYEMTGFGAEQYRAFASSQDIDRAYRDLDHAKLTYVYREFPLQG